MATFYFKPLSVIGSLLLSLIILSGCNHDETPPPDETQEGIAEEIQSTIETDNGDNTTGKQATHNEAFRVESPKPGDSVNYDFTVSGEAQVFEGVFSYRLLDEKGEELVREYVQVNQSDESGEGLWRKFNFTIYLDDHTIPAGTLYLYEESEKDGTAINELEIPIKFTPSE